MSAPVDHAAIAVARDGIPSRVNVDDVDVQVRARRLIFGQRAGLNQALGIAPAFAKEEIRQCLHSVEWHVGQLNRDGCEAAYTALAMMGRNGKGPQIIGLIERYGCPIAAAVTEMHLTAGGR